MFKFIILLFIVVNVVFCWPEPGLECQLCNSLAGDIIKEKLVAQSVSLRIEPSGISLSTILLFQPALEELIEHYCKEFGFQGFVTDCINDFNGVKSEMVKKANQGEAPKQICLDVMPTRCP